MLISKVFQSSNSSLVRMEAPGWCNGEKLAFNRKTRVCGKSRRKAGAP